jgi:hypothetical protein
MTSLSNVGKATAMIVLAPVLAGLREQLVWVARGLDNNPAYAMLNAYGDQGTPVGLTMEVERITSGGTPTATLTLRRSGTRAGTR